MRGRWYDFADVDNFVAYAKFTEENENFSILEVTREMKKHEVERTDLEETDEADVEAKLESAGIVTPPDGKKCLSLLLHVLNC